MKKIISILLLISTLILCLASCGHEHQWSSWTVSQEQTYQKDGTEIRNCTECGEGEVRTLSAYGDEGVQKFLNGHWRAKSATSKAYIDILFDNKNFAVTYYTENIDLSPLNKSGTIEITEDLITLTTSSGKVWSTLGYKIGNGVMVLWDENLEFWEKYES